MNMGGIITGDRVILISMLGKCGERERRIIRGV